ncbi:MAG: winged helix-turn-helix transcriptional regulator [Candidatus Thorarchaeota archaeon]
MFTARLKPYAINAIYAFIFGQSHTQVMDKSISDLGNHNNTWQIILSSRNYMYVGAILENIQQLDEYSSFKSQTAKIQSPIIGLLSGVNYTVPVSYILPKSGSLNYDRLELEITLSLNKDSRKPISEIAEDIRSTLNTVCRRLTRMIEEGVIELSINFNPEATNDTFALFQIITNLTWKKNEFSRYLNEKYNPNLFCCCIFSSLANLIPSWVWTNNMKELTDLIEKIKKEKVEPILFDLL